MSVSNGVSQKNFSAFLFQCKSAFQSSIVYLRWCYINWVIFSIDIGELKRRRDPRYWWEQGESDAYINWGNSKLLERESESYLHLKSIAEHHLPHPLHKLVINWKNKNRYFYHFPSLRLQFDIFGYFPIFCPFSCLVFCMWPKFWDGKKHMKTTYKAPAHTAP